MEDELPVFIALLINCLNKEGYLMNTTNLLIINCNMFHRIIALMSNDIIYKTINYYEEVIPRQSISTFKANFRLSRQTFVVIMDNIIDNPRFRKRSEHLGGREQITPEKCLLVALWTLATPESYRSIGDRFNIARSSIFHCLNTIIQILLYICHKFIKWPNEYEKQEIARNFRKYGLPNVCGAIDGCHIPIKRPTRHGVDYFNRKKYYSMILQCVCTQKLMFTDCDIRWPGSVHDSRVLRTSDLYLLAQQLCGNDYYIIADKAYPLKQWLISPYKNNGHLEQQQIYFDQRLSRTRAVIENAFALLKGRFRRLKDLLDIKGDEAITKNVIACCILHNICLITDGDDIQQFIDEGRDINHIPMILEADFEENNLGIERRLELTNFVWVNR